MQFQQIHSLINSSPYIFKEKELMWCLAFLKSYNTIDVLHTIFNVTWEHMNTAIWAVIKALNARLPDFSFDWSDAPYYTFSSNQRVVGIVDATECFIYRPSQNQEAVYSGYKKAHTLKYNVVISVDGKTILRIDGPYGGPSHDVTMLHLSGLLRTLRPGQLLMGDKKYIGDTRLLSEYLVAFQDLHRFKKIRVRVEHVIGWMKRFKALSGVWRHNFEQHELVTQVIGKMYNFLE